MKRSYDENYKIIIVYFVKILYFTNEKKKSKLTQEISGANYYFRAYYNSKTLLRIINIKFRLMVFYY